MIEQIPNPLTDKGVRQDINDKVNDILEHPQRIGNMNSVIRNAVIRAAEWGMSEGFRMGWKVYENTKGKTKIKKMTQL